MAVALAAAIELGFKVLACPSTGNLANAVAAAAARAGIRRCARSPPTWSRRRSSAPPSTAAPLVAVDGSYDDVNKLASELADEREDWAFVNVNVRPYYAEGSKTIGFEIAEQLGWRLPQQIVVPVASGAQLVKIDKAFRELAALGLVAGYGRGRCSAPRQRAAPRSPPRSRPGRTWSSRSGPTRWPSRWPSATRPTGLTCWTSCGGPAGRWPRRPTTRWWTRSGCWPRPRASSPRPRAGSPWRAAQAAGLRAARPGRRDRHHQLRRRAEDPGRGGARPSPALTPIRPTLAEFAALEARRPSKAGGHERLGPGPHHPARVHRRRGRGRRRAGHPARGPRRAWTPPTRAWPAGSWTTRASCAGSSTSTSVTRTSGSPRAWTRRCRRAARSRSSRRSRAADAGVPALGVSAG